MVKIINADNGLIIETERSTKVVEHQYQEAALNGKKYNITEFVTAREALFHIIEELNINDFDHGVKFKISIINNLDEDLEKEP